MRARARVVVRVYPRIYSFLSVCVRMRASAWPSARVSRPLRASASGSARDPGPCVCMLRPMLPSAHAPCCAAMPASVSSASCVFLFLFMPSVLLWRPHSRYLRGPPSPQNPETSSPVLILSAESDPARKLSPHPDTAQTADSRSTNAPSAFVCIRPAHAGYFEPVQ